MNRKTCEECGGEIERRNVEFKLYGESVGLFPAEVCVKCGEEIFDEKTSDKIDEAVKRRGLWGLGAGAKVIQVGSSTAVVVNKKIADFLKLKKGELVYVHPESKHKLVMEIP